MQATFVIDPGAKGGYCLCLGGLKDVTVFNLDEIGSFLEHLHEYKIYDREVVIEDVPPYAGRNIPSHTAFKLGKSCGLIEGVARGQYIPTHLVTPKEWQKGLSGLKGKTGAPRKRVLKDHAQRIFPHLNITLRNADAVLLAKHFFTNHPTRR